VTMADLSAAVKSSDDKSSFHCTSCGGDITQLLAELVERYSGGLTAPPLTLHSSGNDGRIGDNKLALLAPSSAGSERRSVSVPVDVPVEVEVEVNCTTSENENEKIHNVNSTSNAGNFSTGKASEKVGKNVDKLSPDDSRAVTPISRNTSLNTSDSLLIFDNQEIVEEKITELSADTVDVSTTAVVSEPDVEIAASSGAVEHLDKGKQITRLFQAETALPRANSSSANRGL